MKFFQYSGNCHLSKLLKTSAYPSISLVVLLLATIFILPSLAFAEVRKEYYPSGKLLYERNYINDKLEGIARNYYENGEYKYIDTYKDGKKINRKAYTEEGQLKFNEDYPQ
jgi:hypothetical protein